MRQHVCTAEDPFDPNEHDDFAIHPDLKPIDEKKDGEVDDGPKRYQCPHCYLILRDAQVENARD